VLETPLWTIDQSCDWLQRTLHYPPEAKYFYKKMVPKIQELKKMATAKAGWSNMVTDSSNGVKIDWGKS
jgi:hypothetical protein